jgi:DNA-binding transcriptional regulator YiaG
MTVITEHSRFDATSAAGAMRAMERHETYPMASILPPAEPVVRAEAAIGELRRLSGLTWDQLARLLDVSRRALHFWASGMAMTPANEERLGRLLGVVRQIDRGSASENRAVLLGARGDGTVPFDRLAEGRYEEVVDLLGPGGPPRKPRMKVSAAVLAERAPRPPEELVGALHDRIHHELGTVRKVKIARLPSGR